MKQTKFAAIFLIVAFLSSNIQAQWFGEVRHNINKSTFSNGRKCFSLSLGGPPAGPWGFIRSGYWPFSTSATGPNFEFSFINNQAMYGPGAFYAEYSIFDDAQNCSSPVKKNNCNGVFVVNAWNTGGMEVFGLAGVYDEGLFFSTIDVWGNPVVSYRWDWPYKPNKMPRKPFLAISQVNPGIFYITGDLDNISYVIKLDATTNPATINWSRFYYSGDSLTSRAVMQSPYNPNDIIVVGGRYGSLASGAIGREAFFMTLDDATGNVTNFNTYSFGSDRENCWFTSIKKADCTWGGSDGYLLGGYCTSNALNNWTNPQWMTKLDPAGNTIWSSIIEPIYSTSLNQQTTWEINDVQERLNPITGRYENYGIAGSSIINTTGSSYDYLTVFKLDEDGTRGGLAPTEFRYFKTGRHGVFASCYLDLEESGSPILPKLNDGLDMFAEDFTTADHTWHQTYFNGAARCNDSLTDIISVVDGPQFAQNPVTDWNVFNANCPNMFSLQVNFPNDNLNYVCYTPNIAYGSNARPATTGIASENLEENGLNIYPNPSNGLVFIKSGDGSTLSNATVKIQNHLGQTVAELTPEQLQNNNEGLRVDFSKLNLASGIYFIAISSDQLKTTNYKIVYTKN